MLVQYSLWGKVEKVQLAIDRLRQFEPEEGYYLAFSGGKDSVVIKALADMAGVKYDAHYNLTTVDPPELVYFIREQHPDVAVDRPEITMWELIPKKLMPPTRLVRYCCSELKERGGEGRRVITGVRWEESYKRSQRRMAERCYRGSGKTYVNPIIDWTEQDVWAFIKEHNIPYCKLYDEGYSRLGCIGCPMASKQMRLWEFERYPKFYQAYLRAFERMLVERKRRRKPTQWERAEEVMHWWIHEPGKGNPDQRVIFE